MKFSYDGSDYDIRFMYDFVVTRDFESEVRETTCTISVINPNIPKGKDRYTCVAHGAVVQHVNDKDVKSTARKLALRKAIRCIEQSQSPLGGWHYEPHPGAVSDCSITVCETMALRAARNIGIEVDKDVIDRAFRYIRKAQDDTGGFRYQIGTNSPALLQQVTLGCTAAGVCILNGLGEYDSQSVHRGLDYLNKYYKGSLTRLSRGVLLRSPFHYTHYYAAQAFYGTRGPDWKTYYNYIAAELIRRQRADGSWDEEPGGGPLPATAMAVFVLNVPRAAIPITER